MKEENVLPEQGLGKNEEEVVLYMDDLVDDSSDGGKIEELVPKKDAIEDNHLQL